MKTLAQRSIYLVLLSFLLIFSTLVTAEARVLQNNSNLYIATNKSLSTWFKAGANVNEIAPGVVSSGTLLNNSNLYIASNRSLSTWFRAGTGASFRPDGALSSGTLLNNSNLSILPRTDRCPLGSGQVPAHLFGPMEACILAP